MATAKGISIGAVAQRTGVSADLIRIWERRYAAIEPVRLGDGRRSYLETDVEKIGLLRDATQAGHRIGDVAGLSRAALRKLLIGGAKADRMTIGTAGAPAEVPAEKVLRGRPDLVREALLAAIRAFDSTRLEDVLHLAALQLERRVVVEEVLLPVLREVGDLWAGGEIGVAHEHLATAMVRSFLATLQRGGTIAPAAPHLVVCTPAGELHELGALCVSLLAGGRGWRTTYLGPNLPGKEIVGAAATLNARAVAVSAVCETPDLQHEIESVARGLAPGTALVIGGAAAVRPPAVAGVEVHRVRALRDLDGVLDRIVAGDLARGPIRSN